MNKSIALIFAVATTVRLLVSFVLLPGNTTKDHENNALTQIFGPGVLPALGAAILDPIHTWNHLEEACFWLENSPSLWTASSIGGGGSSIGYNSIYMPGTRVVSPPLVVAFLGETLVCSKSMFTQLLQKILLLLADAIGAYCIYHVGKRIVEMESWTNEAEIERHTKLSEQTKQENSKFNDNLVVPGILRPERGWLFGLPSKIVPREEDLVMGEAATAANGVANGNPQKEGHENGDDESTETTETCTQSSLEEREPILKLNQIQIIVSVLYFCNPISMLANATGSIRSLWDALLLLSIYFATMPPVTITKEGIPIKIKSATKAALSLALVTYADAGYVVFLLPILLWRGLVKSEQSPSSLQKAQHHDWKVVLTLYIMCLGCLHFFASLLVGGEPGTYTKVMVQTLLPNIAFVQQDESGSVPGPSMGLHWYMFVQMFDRFRPYFTVFVAGVPAMFSIPLVIRLHRYPPVLTATFQLLWAIFRPTTTVHTLTLGLLLAMLNPRTIVRMRDPSLISFFALPVPILLFMTFHRMWLVVGNGNPNYIYFQCFAYGLFITIISMDFVSASVKRDKVRRMVEKGSIKKLLKKKEEAEKASQKAPEKDAEDTDDVKPEEAAEESNGSAVEKATEEIIDNAAGDADDGLSQPEPSVVFL